MDITAPFIYNILGTPTIKSAGQHDAADSELRLKHRPSWRLVAYLHQGGGTVENHRVCHDLALESSLSNPNSTLSQIVSDCNRVFGRGMIRREIRSFFLDHGRMETDAAQFEHFVRQSRATPDVADRIVLLRNALALVRGDFLAGFAESPHDWVSKQQKLWRGKTADAGNTLIALYEGQCLSSEAYEVVRRLNTLLPENADISMLLLRYNNEFGAAQAPRKGSLAKWTAYVGQLARQGQTVTLSETKQFNLFFASEWERFQAYHPALKRLSILEGSFDAEFAEAICGVTDDELSDLADCSLLTQHEECYEMPLPMRQWIFDEMDAAQKADWQAEYHEWIRRTFALEVSLHEPPPPKLFNRWKRNVHHLETALNALLDAPLPKPAAQDPVWFDFCPLSTRYFFPDRMQDACHFLAGLLDETPNSYRLAATANVGRLMFSMRQYEAAAQHFQGIEQSWIQKAGNKKFCDYSFLSYVDSLHHGGKVKEAAELLESYLPLIDPVESPHFLHGVLNNYAVSLLALGRFTEAYDASTEGIDLRRKCSCCSPASPLYHQGIALVGLKRHDEALTSFDESLELFKQDYVPHGEADCLQQIGKIHAERGQVNAGKHMIEEALRLYASIHKPHSRAACLRSLGDALKIKGDLKGAEAAYCEGLAFWEEEVEAGRGGSGWVKHFRERLETFSAVPNEVESAENPSELGNRGLMRLVQL